MNNLPILYVGKGNIVYERDYQGNETIREYNENNEEIYYKSDSLQHECWQCIDDIGCVEIREYGETEKKRVRLFTPGYPSIFDEFINGLISVANSRKRYKGGVI